MTYFVTGATGFIGKRLVKKLLARRNAVVYFLIRQESHDKVPELLDYWEYRRLTKKNSLARSNIFFTWLRCTT
jgi:thioester reductase-like protein